ncbi:MAG: hypothetical protein LBU70_05810 [Chitinispirillales bacterium]|jgi:ABC-type Na+ efflux pump permease subunit|nr:hypothetical protein [Chitinispirillales bacterium]
MNGLRTVIRKEFKCFFNSDKSTFLIHALMPIIWSLALYFNSGADMGRVGVFWIFSFAVIVTANFANSVFISERVNGTLEILITSGLSRDAILFGKMFFVIAMTLAVGLICAVWVVVWAHVLPIADGGLPHTGVSTVLLYLLSAFLCASSSAYLSVRMPNPRFLHFINLFMMSAVAAVYSVLETVYFVHPSISIILFLLLCVIFLLLARREFAGERIIRPIIF